MNVDTYTSYQIVYVYTYVCMYIYIYTYKHIRSHTHIYAHIIEILKLTEVFSLSTCFNPKLPAPNSVLPVDGWEAEELPLVAEAPQEIVVKSMLSMFAVTKFKIQLTSGILHSKHGPV